MENTKTIEWKTATLRDYKLADVEPLLTFIRKNKDQLADEADRDSFEEVLGYLETAKSLADTARKRVALMDATTKYANQLAFRLYTENNLSEEVAAIFREFRTVKDVSTDAREYRDLDQTHADSITKLQQEYMAEREDFDVFLAVIGGMTEAEAKQKQQAFRERQRQALEGQRQ